MNDTELDEILNQWSAPPAPASLRERVRAGFAGRPRLKTSRGVPPWISAFAPSAKKSLVAGAILAVGAFFLVIALALPQTHEPVSLPAGVPYIVDSDVVRYADDGISAVEEHRGSYNDNGREVGVYAVYPSFLNAIWHALMAAGSVVGRLTLPFTVSPELLKKFESAARVSADSEHGYALGSAAALIDAGCVCGPLVGHETILGHPTVAVQPNLEGDHQRVTFWMAPDLGCFALRITVEEKRPDGTYRLLIRKQALKVTFNHPPAQ
jgi:hypothetical protein